MVLLYNTRPYADQRINFAGGTLKPCRRERRCIEVAVEDPGILKDRNSREDYGEALKKSVFSPGGIDSQSPFPYTAVRAAFYGKTDLRSIRKRWTNRGTDP
jgi:hypothetical protein